MYEDVASELAKGKKKRKPAEGGAEEEAAESPEEEAAEGDDGEEEEGDMESYDKVEESAAHELATLAGVKDKEAWTGALSDYVEACVRRAMDKGKQE